jgi:mRNA-degrading endonuclease RelE of RelBE toxin-antitoxin system
VTSSFQRTIKKLNQNQFESIEGAIQEIAQNPSLGVLKKQDLNEFRVLKFRILGQTWLLAYRFDGAATITLHAVGPHENFYEKLKRGLP